MPDLASPPAALPPESAAPAASDQRGRPGLAAASLGAALVALFLFAAFSREITDLTAQSRLHVAIAAVALAALAHGLFGRGLRAAAPSTTRIGLALLALFAAWTGLTLVWSITPDATWIELNRTVGLVLAATLSVVLGASLPRAAERVGLAYVAVAVAVALYAVGGKALPGLNVPGVFDLNHTADFSRLREPIGYWNALSLFCVLAVPPALRTAAGSGHGPRLRMAAAGALVPLLVTVVLSYSRGGIFALGVAVAALLVMCRDRLRICAWLGAAVVGAAPAVAVGLARDDLTADALSVSARTDGGAVFLAAFVAGLAVTLSLSVDLARADERLTRPHRSRVRKLKHAAAAAGLALMIGVGALAVAGGGPGAAADELYRNFTSADLDRPNEPGRLLAGGSGNRWVWWSEAAGAWWDRPLLGHGAGSFASLHLLHRDNRLPVRDAHSVPLQFMAETGLIGAMLALGGLAALGLAALRRVRSERVGERGPTAALAAGAVAWGAHMWLDWDWDIAAVTLPVLLFLGVLAARPRERSPAPAPLGPPAWRAAALALGTMLACAIALSAVLPALAREKASDAYEIAGAGSPRALARAAETAELGRRLDPLAIEPVFAAANIAERRRRFREASRLLAEAARRQPSDPRVWENLTRFQFFAGDPQASFRSAAVLRRLDPQRETPFAFVEFVDPGAESAAATGTPLRP